MSGLSSEQESIVAELVRGLAGLRGVAAVVLGGSRARGVARPDSDIDLGVYYRESAPFDVDELRALARALGDSSDPVVTDYWGWGPWVNGGCWLTIRGQRVDLIYRSLEHVERTIDDCERGIVQFHFEQQPPYGFASPTYLAETAFCQPLHDPEALLEGLKRRVAAYPEALARVVVSSRLWSVEFTLYHARKYAGAGDVYDTVGCLTRSASALVQALFALNRRYFTSDKSALAEIEGFPLQPRDFGTRIERVLLASPDLGFAVKDLAALLGETIELSGDLYRSKYAELP